MNSKITQLQDAIAQEHSILSHHPVFAAIATQDQLRRFMEWHVFAVWDFMSLLKRLQAELTTVLLPWVPPANPTAARLINEIVLGEESDDGMGGGYVSHYMLYLNAMRDVGAGTDQIRQFVALLSRRGDLESAFAQADVAAPVAAFVRSTLGTAMKGSLPQVLGSFFYGRENVIPSMFKSLLAQWKIAPADAPAFVYYLERHIALDTDRHGPAAKSIIDEIVGGDADKMEALLSAALAAVRARHQFWDALQLVLTTVPGD